MQLSYTDGERRHLTVMFCDLVDSTIIAERLDPEEYTDLISSYQQACERAIAKYKGHIAQYLGDGILAYFGYPLAHEDDAVRATYAALLIVEDVGRQLNPTIKSEIGIALSVRVGIHSGETVIAGAARQEQYESLAFGHTVNIAARLVGIAKPDSIAISAATLRLVSGLFITESLGEFSLKGVSGAVQVYRVLRPSGFRSRLEAASRSSLTPFVGREFETDLMLDCWTNAQKGNGRVLLVSGDPGIGKSRLVLELQKHLVSQPHTWLECRGSPYYADSAMYPITDLLRLGLQFRHDDTQESRLNKLERALASAGFQLSDTVPLFTQLLLLPLPESYPPLMLSPEAQRRKTLGTLSAWLCGLASSQPVVLVVEDLHWIDPTTLSLVEILINDIATAPVFLVLTFRPHFSYPWKKQPHLYDLNLGPLTDEQVQAMASSALNGKSLDRGRIERLLAKADGVPLFVEELLKMIIELWPISEEGQQYGSGDSLSLPAIPHTLHDLLIARLDHLSDGKSFVQLGAVVGRDFSYELLRDAFSLQEQKLKKGLDEAIVAGILYQTGSAPFYTYSFKHALIQEIAYNCILKSKRQKAHRQVALTLQHHYPEISAGVPEVLAHHFERAGMIAEAIGALHRAGQRALAYSAHIEAVNHFSRALRLLGNLPENPQRDQLELGLQVALGVGLTATRGYAADSVQRAFARARELCKEISQDKEYFQVLFGLWMFNFVRSNKTDVFEIIGELIKFAEGSNDPDLLVEAYGAAGVTTLFRGMHVQAQQLMSQALEFYRPEQHHSHAFVYGQEPGAVLHAYRSINLWFSGYADQALAESEKAIAIGEKVAHPFTLAGILNFGSVLYHYRRDLERLSDMAEKTITLCAEQGFPLWYGAGLCERGWVRVIRGDVMEGIGLIREGLGHILSTGCRLTLPYHNGTLVEALLKAGLIEEAQTQVETALVQAYELLDHYHLPELHRLKAELLLLDRARTTEAENSLRTALEIARSQGARALELRSATSLGRFLIASGRSKQALEILRPVYNWFTEGLETADLLDAGQLLREISQ